MRVAVEGASPMKIFGSIWLSALTTLPSGIDPFRAVGLHLGAAALIGFILHVLTRGAAGRSA
ncbi:hypothetical protein [Micrococcus luteus]|uniref:hypothetical protein n=1 Tax=Micrococcus luteus TaxID=1270 RepID=UPI00200512C0|nr:hypothetical protein [Micrococcus luteus]MCK6057914.1 hypothetical protein [Micrococcus luteus]MCK6062483.1 hypothetical protein [Micrococcus luteus]MCK6064732.1 hypothetical protein [Micrococcus luteus]MCK6192997.1 hypothetical protein [Micrococcus luteus]MCK6195211.1 hypothetical protein [Micrococcus luteus]